jgi:hypothetical protein
MKEIDPMEDTGKRLSRTSNGIYIGEVRTKEIKVAGDFQKTKAYAVVEGED